MIEQKLIELLNSIENEVIEFKESKNGFDDDRLGKYFSALSNESNLRGLDCAWLVFGIKDNNEIIGTQYRNTEKELLAVKKMIADNTNNNISFKEIYTLKYQGKRIVLFEIPPALKGIPTAWKGHYYARQGESLTSLDLHKIEQIRNQQNVLDWSAGIVENADLSDLCPNAILMAREKYKQKNPKLANEVDNWNDETFLNKAKLTIKGKITRTAIILLGLPESESLINPASPTITWILKNKDGIERDYEHFGSPLLLNVDKVANKIRNLKYRYIKQGTLFPDEVDQYDNYVLREALHNAIAHQDYTLQGKISLVEFEDSKIVFKNKGRFIPNTILQVLESDAPEENYRNRFLANAMVELNMIDTIGSGIRKMFFTQKQRFFPLPEYDIGNDSVQVTIIGRVLDIKYAERLAKSPELSLSDIILLDKLQKNKPLADNEAKYLKKMGLIEGRKPNYYISVDIAKLSGDEVHYTKQKGLDDQFYKELILEYLRQFKTGKADKLRALLYDKLPNHLNEQQKLDKVRNLLQSLKKEGKIVTENKIWRLV